MSEFKKYYRKTYIEARPYIPGEDMSNVYCFKYEPAEGGMILRNRDDIEYQFYLPEEVFNKQFKLEV